jgi:phosphoglycolate phosphatase
MNLLFDLDGTLTDAGPGIIRCVRHALAELGRPADAAADLGWCIGPPLRDSFAELLAGGDPTLPDRAVALYRERYETAGLFENSVYPGVADGLARLRAAGHALRVVTSKPHVYARRILAHFDLLDAFTEVYGAEFSGVNADKRDLIRHVLSAERFRERPWMIGDRRHDVEGAHANGIPAVGVLWGYGSRAELQAAGADVLVESMEDLLAWSRQEPARTGTGS